MWGTAVIACRLLVKELVEKGRMQKFVARKGEAKR